MDSINYSIIGILAIVIHLIVNYEFLLTKKEFTKKADIYYKHFLRTVLMYFAVDVLWGLISYFELSDILYADTIVYYLLMAVSVVYWCKYVISYLKIEGYAGKVLMIIGMVFCSGEVVLLLINHFVHIFFWIDDDCKYHAYLFRYIALFIQIALFVYVFTLSVVVAAKSSGALRRRHITIGAFSFSMIISAIFQTLLPLYPVYSLGLMIGLLVIHVFVQEDEKDEFRNEIEKKRKELQKTYDIFAAAGFGIWQMKISKNEPCTLYLDKKLQEIYGTEGMDFKPQELFDYYHSRLEDDKEIEADDYIDMMSGKIRSRLLVWDHPKKGKIYLRSGGTKHILDDGSEVLSGYCGDITEQKLSYERINARLSEAKKQADAANKAKTKFLLNMSHDIRTPMNAIMGYSELLEKNYDNKEKSSRYLSNIKRSSKYLLSLISNVLEMARIESGKITLEENPIDINVLEETVHSIFEELMIEKHVDFKVNVNVTHPYIMSDAVKIRRVILNILSNAYKFTPDGGSVTMNIEELPSKKEGTGVYKMTVSDTGIGMKEDFVPRIFEEFSREHDSSGNNIEGTGLGMSIVKRILDLMDAKISVKSEFGKGSVFEVVLECPVIYDFKNAELENKATLLSKIKGRRVLLAEDNNLNAEIILEILDELEISAERVENGLECVNKIKEMDAGFYDLILMDIQMPGPDGYETTERIRCLSNQEKAVIPIIAMTANAFEEDKKQAFASGMNGHIAKPINVDELIRKIAGVL